MRANAKQIVMMADEPLVGVPEAARQLNMSMDWVYDHAEELAGVWIGGRLKFQPAAIRAFKRGESVAIQRVVGR